MNISKKVNKVASEMFDDLDGTIKASTEKIKETTDLFMLNFEDNDKAQLYHDLEKTNSTRRKLLKDAESMDTLRAVFRIRNTIMVSVVCDLQFWFSVGIYFVTRWIEVDEFAKTVPYQPVSFVAVGILGGLMSFLLVFYVSQSYARFYTQYDIAMQMQARIYDLVLLAREKFPPASALQFYRYANAAQIVGYVGLSDIYNEDNFLRPINVVWKLLTPSEMERLVSLGCDKDGTAYREVISWMHQAATGAFKSSIITANEFSALINAIMTLTSKISNLYEYADQPMPFAYTQFVYFMSAVYLPYFSYTLANNMRLLDRTQPNELVGIVGVFLNCVFVIGLRVLCKKLQDPFGPDLANLSVFHYCHFTLETSAKIMKANRIDVADLEVETAMQDGRPPLGNGF